MVPNRQCGATIEQENEKKKLLLNDRHHSQPVIGV